MSGLPSGNVYIKQLDGLRFFAVMLVALQHWVFNPLEIKVPSGLIGVTLFFVISGFLISSILLSLKNKNEVTEKGKGYYIKQFYIRRFLRIFPVYYLVIAVLYIFNAGVVRETMGWLLTYTINIRFAIQSKYDPVTSHFWTLAVEEQFYLIYPFLILFINRKYLLQFFLSFILLGIGSRLGFFLAGVNDRSNTFITTTCFDAFGLGGLLAYFMMYKKDWVEKYICSYKFLLINCGLLLLFAFLRSRFGDEASLRVVWFRFFIASISLWFVTKSLFQFKGISKHILENSFVVYTGKISYGWYVYHNIVPKIFQYFGYHQTLKMIIPYLISTYVISILSWKLFEYPVNELKNKFQY